jgi:NADH:ubiquinone oxidoreductase subunit C
LIASAAERRPTCEEPVQEQPSTTGSTPPDATPPDSATTGPSAVEIAVSRVAGTLQAIVPDVAPQPIRDYVEVTVPSAQLEACARALKERLGYRYLSMVTAVDYPDRITVLYLIFTLEDQHGVYLKTDLPREELPDCPTLTTVWPGAEYQEREVYDLMGVNFVGHPDMTRILTEDDFPGHPLRKDFWIEPDYVLMRHLRFGVDGQFRPESEDSVNRSPGGSNGGGA